MLEKDGTLVANQVFRRDLATEYALQIQVNVLCLLKGSSVWQVLEIFFQSENDTVWSNLLMCSAELKR